MLSQTKIAVAMPESELQALTDLGEIIYPALGDRLFQINDRSDYLYIIVDGDIHLTDHDADDQPIWLGPGDIVGEIGFLLATPRTKTATVVSDDCCLWRLSRAILSRPYTSIKSLLLGHLFIALAPYVQIRLASKLAAANGPGRDLLENHCDYTHPAIRWTAASLRHDDPWDTAIATWDYVRHLPYRFGPWQLKASQTLRLGYGSCTTKANLQTALLRANGIEARVSETEVESQFLMALMPRGYRRRVRPQVKHYFAAAKLDNRWTACEASFTPPTLQVIAAENTVAATFADRVMERGRPLNLANDALGLDAYDLNLLPNLARIMQKRPFYNEDQAAGMNIVLDKLQGYVGHMPVWVNQARQLLRQKPEVGFLQAYAGINADVAKLHETCLVAA